LEQGFAGIQINTAEMTDLATLAADLLANFRTIRILSSGHPEGRPENWLARAKARRAESLAAYAYRDRLRRILVEHGYHRFLHDMERDPEGGWRLHVFLAEDTALTLLDEVTEGTCGPGDPVAFNPEEFVAGRLRDLLPYCLDDS
jgi:hypothetical protein